MSAEETVTIHVETRNAESRRSGSASRGSAVTAANCGNQKATFATTAPAA